MDTTYEDIVAAWLVADGRTLIASQYPLRIGEPSASEPVRWPDILAVRPKEKHVLICEVTWSKDWSRLRKKIAVYRDHVDNIRASLENWLGVGDEAWQLSLRYFVPDADVIKIEESIDPDDRLPVKFTPLESIKPWTYTWGFRET